MTDDAATAITHAPPSLPKVRKIGLRDVRDALAKGWADFMANPGHVLVLGVLYPILGLLIARFAFGHDLLPLVFPLAAGFALLGPFAATGFYEISRRRERGETPSWFDVLGLLGAKSRVSMLTLGALLLAIFAAWIGTAETIYEALFGSEPVTSLSAFVHQVFETSEGKKLMTIGIGAGFLFALATFSISVVSFPLLVDRDVSAPAAVVTSVRAVLASPVAMTAWAVIVAAVLIVASLPALLGLAVALPVLGHATWHVYRRAVV
jgi:uncharacterized membrane protein